MRFELLMMDADHNETIATWDGKNGRDAAQRYANAHPGMKVYAFRIPDTDRDPIAIGMPHMNILEPGHRDWGKNAEYRRRYEAMKTEEKR